LVRKEKGKLQSEWSDCKTTQTALFGPPKLQSECAPTIVGREFNPTLTNTYREREYKLENLAVLLSCVRDWFSYKSETSFGIPGVPSPRATDKAINTETRRPQHFFLVFSFFWCTRTRLLLFDWASVRGTTGMLKTDLHPKCTQLILKPVTHAGSSSQHWR